MITKIRRSQVISVNLDPVIGHEQAGYRPAIIVSDPANLSEMRFPLLAVIPVTRTPVSGAYSVKVPTGCGGLKADSFALIDQIRSIDVRRVARTYGIIPSGVTAKIDEALRDFLAL